MAQYDVADRSAIVTGGGSGIGRAVALTLAASGAAVLVTDLNEEHAKAVAAEIEAAGGTAAALAGDVTDPAFAVASVEAANALAPLKIAVNNAGIGGAAAPVADYSLDSWRKVIEVNLNAVLYSMQPQLTAMAANGGGAIVNMASILGSVGFANSSAYVTAKHGLLGLARVIAKEGGQHGIRANVICPGFVRTPLVEKQIPEQAAELGIPEKEVIERIMLGETVDKEFTTVEDVAEVAFMFAAFPTNALTGQALNVSHGWNMA